MNIFVPLILGILFGLTVRGRMRLDLSAPTTVALLVMVFLLGIKTGEVHVSGLWLLSVSLLFSILTIAGSILLGVLIG